MPLLMILGAVIDLKSPVELFQQHDPGQVVGKGHGGHAHPDPGLAFQPFLQPIGASDQENKMLGGAIFPGA